jgi:hypothetical protein
MPLRQPFSIACLAALVLAPLPAAARGQDHDDVAKRLADPGTQAAVAVALTALSESLLDLRIEPIRRAMAAAGDDPASNLPPDARLRDLAGPAADRVPGEIGRRVPQAMGAAAGMAGAMEDMVPELKAIAERMKDALPKQ